jgi:hypothetical protein
MTVFVENEDEGKESYIHKPVDFIGDYALLDDTNWSASTIISMSCSSEAHAEVYTADTHFVVCLELEAAVFQTIVEAHSFYIVSTLSHLKRLRTEHTTPTDGVIFRTFQVMARWERLINALLVAGDSVPDSARTSAGSLHKRCIGTLIACAPFVSRLWSLSRFLVMGMLLLKRPKMDCARKLTQQEQVGVAAPNITSQNKARTHTYMSASALASTCAHLIKNASHVHG